MPSSCSQPCGSTLYSQHPPCDMLPRHPRRDQSQSYVSFVAVWLLLGLPQCFAASSASLSEGKALIRSDAASPQLDRKLHHGNRTRTALARALTRHDNAVTSVDETRSGALESRPVTAAAVISSSGVKFVAAGKGNKAHNVSSPEGREVVSLEEMGTRQRTTFSGLTAPTSSSAANSTNETIEEEAEEEIVYVEKHPPKKVYFSVAMAVFMVSFVAMVISLESLGYRQVEPGSGGENPQDEDAPAASRAPRVTHPGSDVPFRLQQVLISWIHIIASIVYFMDFLALQADFGMFRHWCGVVSSTQWLLGFMVQIHWHHSVGDNDAVLASAYMKAVACIFSNVHPLAMMTGSKESDPGVWWPAFVAIALWHVGNLIICIHFKVQPPNGSRQDRGWLFHGNLPITEAWIDQGATWFLIISSLLTTHWLGKNSDQLVSTKSWGIAGCQFAGAAAFLFGSCLHCEWCDGFRNWSHREQVREIAG